MNRVLHFSRQADLFESLAVRSVGEISDSYLCIAAAYRAMAQSLVTEFWWPRQPRLLPRCPRET
jgi:hypothetical protein